ncbi:hypothetical protein [Agromyces sp. PvR057]|uniref:hypothetical protein n=1 Tax=Agromyces sp. PvR057 TaxID=3156403 RepID=UPI000E3871B3
MQPAAPSAPANAIGLVLGVGAGLGFAWQSASYLVRVIRKRPRRLQVTRQNGFDTGV